MPFLAGIAFERETWAKEFVRIGKLWYNPAEHHCSLMLHGFRFGQFVAKPYDMDVAPFLKGDIKIQSGEYEKDGSLIKDYLWVGFIWTESNQRGHVYNIRLEVDPMPIVLANAVNKGGPMKTGMFLSVHLEDKDERKII